MIQIILNIIKILFNHAKKTGLPAEDKLAIADMLSIGKEEIRKLAESLDLPTPTKYDRDTLDAVISKLKAHRWDQVNVDVPIKVYILDQHILLIEGMKKD